jgi:hypothetical protein
MSAAVSDQKSTSKDLNDPLCLRVLPWSAVRISVVLLVWTACSSPSVSPSAPQNPADEPARAPHVAGAAATPCPAGYGSTDTCTPAEPRQTTRRQRTNFGQGPGPAEDVATLEWPRCTYLEGTCECLQEPRTCRGGAAVLPSPPVTQPALSHWQCSPMIRADGCPGAEPRTGDSCTVTHSCGYCITLYSCEGGRWSIPVFGPPAP